MLSGKVAIVTGAAQGIGLGTTTLLLKSGAKVAALDISETTLTKACDDLGKEFGTDNILPLQCDVTDKEAFVAVFGKVAKHFGSLDILVNNAGSADERDWEKMLLVNLHAVIRGTYTAMDHMSTKKGGKGGVVVNVSSLSGLVPTFGARVYTASKFGVVGFTRGLKMSSILEGVRVNCICPGFVDTPLTRGGLELSPNLEMKKAILDAVDKMGGWLSTEFVAEGILKLITDTSLQGEIMRVTPRKGHHFQQYEERTPENAFEDFLLPINDLLPKKENK